MKIAFGHHLSLAYMGGGEKWLLQLAEELSRRGHEVEIRSLPLTLPDGRKLPIRLPEGVGYREGFFHDLTDADVSYVTYHPLNWLSFKTRRPRIAGIHSHCYWQPLALRYGALPNLANLMNRLTSKRELGRFDAVHMVTDAYGVAHDRVYHIPNFVDSRFYHPSKPKADEFTVAYASRKVWQKGYDLFLKVSDRLRGRVRFVETRNTPEASMPEFYSSSHATIVPARVDTFGLTIVESMLCGTPVVSSGLPAHRALRLPISFASTPEGYEKEILRFKSIWEGDGYGELSENCRLQAMRYDKRRIVDRIEEMFFEVSRL